MLKFLLEKEFKQILRNPFLSRMILVMPIMAIVVFPFVTNQEVRDVKLGVVDYDHTPASEQLIQKASQSGYFCLTGVSSSYREMLDEVEAGRVDLILEISADFERNLYRGESAKVMISANSVNGTRGGLGAQYLSAIVGNYGAELRTYESPTGGASVVSRVPTFRPQVRYEFNPTLDYKVFMIPALLVVVVTLLVSSLTALNIVGEKEKGTIEQINVTPVPKSLFILAKLIPNWVIGFLAMSFGMLLAVGVHGLVPAGSVLTVAVFVGVYVLVFSGMGLVISNYSHTMQQAMFITFLFSMILMLTSGLFTPVDSMPELAQQITALNPVRYFAEVMRLIYLKGSRFAEMLPQFCWLLGFAVALNVWAVASYRKSR